MPAEAVPDGVGFEAVGQIVRRKASHIFAIVAIGANLPSAAGNSPLQSCEGAARAVAGAAGLRRVVRSRWFASAPLPVSDQPTYINGVLHLETDITPAALLHTLQAIERAAGRTRPAPNAPRTLDLDIIDMGGLVRAAPDPILPHPRAHQRAFVLLPLRDVAPHWTHPVLHQTVQALIEALPPQGIAPCWRMIAPG